jgi:hypothetical protein
MPSAIDLVGPKGYEHGWKYVGGPGLPSSPAGHGSAKPVQVRHEGMGTHGVYVNGKRIGGVTSVGGGVHYAYREGVEGTTAHGSLNDAVKHMVKAHKASPSSTDMSSQYGRRIDMAAPKLGSGARFRKLSATLAARGASNPDALAAWIGRRKYGAKGMGALSHSHSNMSPLTILLAGSMSKCPACGYSADSAKFSVSGGASGTSVPSAPGDLKTPDRTTTAATGIGSDRMSLNIAARSAPHALSNTGQPAIGLANSRMPAVRSAADVLVTRGAEPGSAIVRHRMGASLVGEIRKLDDGQWAAIGPDGRQIAARTHHRTALFDVIGGYNRTVTPGIQPQPKQSPLMQHFGIPAVSALATPMTSSGSGPRTTVSAASDSDDDGTDENGLNAKGRAIYAKLKAKMPPARALAFAKNAQNMHAGKFQKAS